MAGAYHPPLRIQADVGLGIISHMDFRDIVSRERAKRRGNRQADASKSASEASEENVPHSLQGRPEEALREAERITELLPEDANAWYNKGIALLQLNRHEEALRSF
jgi:tetratricopeptide (TPR) repeat protein